MYSQDIIDASVMLDTGIQNLDPDYFSGDTTDSQKARMLRSDNNMRIDLTNRKDAKVYIMYTISPMHMTRWQRLIILCGHNG